MGLQNCRVAGPGNVPGGLGLVEFRESRVVKASWAGMIRSDRRQSSQDEVYVD